MQLDIYEQGWIFPGNTSYNDGKGAVSIDLLVQTINAVSDAEFKWLQHDLIIYEDLNILDGVTPLVEDIDYIKGPENNEISAFIAAYRSLPTTSIHVVTGIYIQNTGHLGNDLTVSGKYAGDEISMRDIPNILAETTVYEISTSSDEVHALPDARLVDNQHIVKRRGDGSGIVTFTTENSQTIDILAATELTLEGDSSIILIPKSGNWESVKTGGAANLVSGALSTTIAVNKLVYFNSSGKLDIGDKGELSKAILAGFLTKAGVLDDVRYVQSSGILDGFTGLAEGTQYFLGDTGDIVVKGSINYNDYIVSIGVAISTTEIDVSIRVPDLTRNQDDGTPISALVKFPVYKDRTGQGYLPYTHNSFSQSNYSNLFSEIGHVYNDMHVQAGGADLSASGTLFYATPIPGYYERGGTEDTAVIDSTTGVDDTTELITLTTADYDALHMTRGVLGTGASGVPVRLKLVSGALPTGLAEDTTYFINFGTTPDISLHTTEALAIAGTSAIDLTDAVGTFKLTQEGIVLDDAMQGHWHPAYSGGQTLKPPGTANNTYDDTPIISLGPTPNTLSGYLIGDAEPDTVNGTPRITNETRPKTFISFGYIKAEHITTAGEPISALLDEQDWVEFTGDWRNKEFIVTPNFPYDPADLYKYNIDVWLADDATPTNPTRVLTITRAYDLAVGTDIDFFYGISVHSNDSASFKLFTANNGVYYQNPSGAQTYLGLSSTGAYKVVITKPNLITTTFDISGMPKTVDLTSLDYTYTLPAITGAPQRKTIRWQNGGSNILTMATADSATIGGLTAGTWQGEGEGVMVVESDGTSNWIVVEYEDSGSNSNGNWQKERNGNLKQYGTFNGPLASGATVTHTFPFINIDLTTSVLISFQHIGATVIASSTVIISGLTTTTFTAMRENNSNLDLFADVAWSSQGRWRE